MDLKEIALSDLEGFKFLLDIENIEYDLPYNKKRLHINLDYYDKVLYLMSKYNIKYKHRNFNVNIIKTDNNFKIYFFNNK